MQTLLTKFLQRKKAQKGTVVVGQRNEYSQSLLHLPGLVKVAAGMRFGERGNYFGLAFCGMLDTCLIFELKDAPGQHFIPTLSKAHPVPTPYAFYSSCSSVAALGGDTEEPSLCRAVCITSVINWMLPRADSVEHFFLLFLRLDHLLAGRSLLRTAANAEGNQMFPTIPYNHTVIIFPTILPLSSQQNSISDFLSLSWGAIFSLSPSSCHLLLLFFENWWNSHQPWVTNQLSCFLSLCQFWISFGYLERLCWFGLFSSG